MKILFIIALILVITFFIRKFLSRFKFPKTTSVAIFTGGIKVGKSAVSLAHALSEYRRVLFGYKLECFFIKILNIFIRKKENKISFSEKPLFYSNIPLRDIPFVPLTTEHLLRKKRIAYKSVCFVDEASLVADSQLIKDKVVNTQLLLFFKLFGHETHGGKCILNSHCLSDLHFSLKRVTSQYFYIHSLTKYIPFFIVANLREERYSEDNTTVNSYDTDIEDSVKRVLIRKSIFKKYDSFCYSYLTDYLETDNENDEILLNKFDDLKASSVVSFRPEFIELKSKEDIIKYFELLSKNKEIKENEEENS